MRYYKIVLLIFAYLYVPSLWGVQKIVVSDSDVIKVKLSSRELTRIAVEGGRVEKLWGAAGMLETQVDKKEGEVFLRPSGLSANVLSFFIRDSYGSTYTLIAEQNDIPSQTIILSPTHKISKIEKEKYKNRPFVIAIKELIKILYREDADAKNYDVKEANEEIKLWKEVILIHFKTYSGEKLLGEVYKLKNISKQEMQLSENEFLNFRPNILAIAIEKLSLNQNETTKIYIVRENNVRRNNMDKR